MRLLRLNLHQIFVITLIVPKYKEIKTSNGMYNKLDEGWNNYRRHKANKKRSKKPESQENSWNLTVIRKQSYSPVFQSSVSCFSPNWLPKKKGFHLAKYHKNILWWMKEKTSLKIFAKLLSQNILLTPVTQWAPLRPYSTSGEKLISPCTDPGACQKLSDIGYSIIIRWVVQEWRTTNWKFREYPQLLFPS